MSNIRFAIICANLSRPKNQRKVESDFKSVEEHKVHSIQLQDDDEQIGIDEILLNLTEPTLKKENTTIVSQLW